VAEAENEAGRGSAAERLVAEVRAMPRADFVTEIERARASDPAEIVARQRVERRERAEAAAARLA
jgi:hypothetical protein